MMLDTELEAFEGVQNLTDSPKEYQRDGKIYLFAPGEKRVLPRDVAEFLVHKSTTFRDGKAALGKCDLMEAVEAEKDRKKAVAAVLPKAISPETLGEMQRAIEVGLSKEIKEAFVKMEAELEQRLTEKVGKALAVALLKELGEESKKVAAQAAKDALGPALEPLIQVALESVPKLTQEAVTKAVEEKLTAAQASDLHKGILERLAADKLGAIVAGQLPEVVKGQIEAKLSEGKKK
ncbi:MAG: hypothetical protein KGR26_14635 [Cyanobacteria bacterium REEB65]|nr:hypothetical protein [Cyanobacteria bacterium REEB65]